MSSRAVHGHELFRDAHDIRVFERLLERAARRHEWEVRLLRLWESGYEVVLELHCPNPSLTGGMRLLNGAYAARFNRRYGRSGHVFGSRYRVEPVEPTAPGDTSRV